MKVKSHHGNREAYLYEDIPIPFFKNFCIIIKSIWWEREVMYKDIIE